MKTRLIIITLLLLIMSTGLSYSQTVNLEGIGLNSPNGQSVNVGQTVTIKVIYTASGFDTDNGDYIVGLARGNTGESDDQIQIVWYQNSDGTGLTTSQNLAVASFEDQTLENGVIANRLVTFTLPAPPANRTSFRVKVRVYGDNQGTSVYSSLDISNSFSGYYGLCRVTNATTIAQNVTISGSPKRLNTLTGTYTFYNADGYPEAASAYRWLRSSSASGSFSPIVGATNRTYVVTDDDVDQFLRFEVTPVSASPLPNTGVPTLSSVSTQVTEAPSIVIANSPYTISESVANNGTLGASTVVVDLNNATFKTGTISGIILGSSMPVGITVGNIERVNSTRIRISFSGAAVNHEFASSVFDPNNILITIPKDQINGSDFPLTSLDGFYIQFSNNPPNNFRATSGNSQTSLVWQRPLGVPSKTVLNYSIKRNGTIIKTTTSLSYTDAGLTNGTAYNYSVMASYVAGGDVETNQLSITPKSNAKQLIAYSFQGISPVVNGIVNESDKTVTLTVPANTNLSTLKGSFTLSAYAFAKVNDSIQTSGVTINNFNTPLIYTIVAQDSSTVNYTVNVLKEVSVAQIVQTVSIDPSIHGQRFFAFSLQSANGTAVLKQVKVALVGSFSTSQITKFYLYKEDGTRADLPLDSADPVEPGNQLVFSNFTTDVNATVSKYYVLASLTGGPDFGHITGSIPAGGIEFVNYTGTFPTTAITGNDTVLPITLASFTIANYHTDVLLKWVTESEQENEGFNVYRGTSQNAISTQTAVRLNGELIQGHGTTSQQNIYSFQDSNSLTPNTTYWYWLETVNLDGSTKLFPAQTFVYATQGETPVPTPVSYGLQRNYPNPFKSSTTISFATRGSELATLAIYNLKGQLVKMLYMNQTEKNKNYLITWNGVDEMGKSVAAGTYFARLTSSTQNATHKIVLIK